MRMAELLPQMLTNHIGEQSKALAGPAQADRRSATRRIKFKDAKIEKHHVRAAR